MAYKQNNFITILGILIIVGAMFSTSYINLISSFVILLLGIIILLKNKTKANSVDWEIILKTLKSEDIPKVDKITEIEVKKAVLNLNNYIKDLKVSNTYRQKFFEEIVDNVNNGILIIEENEIVYNNNFSTRLLGLPNIQAIDRTILTKIIKQDKINTNNHTLKITRSYFFYDNKHLILISFNDISKDIDKSRTETSLNIIRILNHELMNSIAPISSLSASALNLTDQDDLKLALHTINNRSKKLIEFVNGYKKITNLDKPKIQIISFKQIISPLLSLLQVELNNIKLEIAIEPSDIEIAVDTQMFEQLLINLLKNAIDALKNIKHPVIKISAKNLLDKKEISVSNNGSVIPKEVINKVFLPFYTTKQEGSGIGLALCNSIVQKHNGHISVISNDTKTCFKIEL